MYTIMF